MLSGDLYRADDPELVTERYRCQSLTAWSPGTSRRASSRWGCHAGCSNGRPRPKS